MNFGPALAPAPTVPGFPMQVPAGIRRPGMFGNSGSLPQPGPATGYGGGTFNLDGNPATPINRATGTSQPLVVPDLPRPQDQTSAGAPGAFGLESVLAGLEPKPLSTLQKIAMIVGPALMAAGGNQAGANTMLGMMYKTRQEQSQRRWEVAKIAQQQAAEQARQQANRQFEIDHPMPTAVMQNHRYILSTLGPDAAEAYLRSQGDPTVTMTLPGDNFYSGPRSQLGATLNGMGFNQVGQGPTKPVGALTPIPDPQPATIGNTPAPTLGANGMPSRMTRAQYAATVAALGQAKTDDWVRRNNVMIGN